MKTNNALKDFPKSFAVYNALRAASITPYEWLTHPTNKYKFPTRVYKVIRKIDCLAKKHGHSYAHLDTIAFYLKICRRTLQRYLRRLTYAEIIEEIIKGNDRWYKVNWHLLRNYKTENIFNINLDSKSAYSQTNVIANVIPAYFVTTDKQIIYPLNGDTPVKIKNHHGISNITIAVITEVKTLINNDLPLSDSINTQSIRETKQEKEKDFTVKVDIDNNLNNLSQLDPIEEEIKQEFESISSTKLNLKRDSKALKQLKDLFSQAKDIVLEAFRNVANHLANTKGKIYSLSYVLTTAKNLLKSKNRQKKDDLSPEDRRNLQIGGKVSQSKAATPEELKQATLELQTQEENLRLREELFDSLDKDSKEELIKDAVEIIKTQTPNIWEKLKPKFPWFDQNPIINHAIERVKDFLLKEHLEFLAYQDLLADSS